MHKLLRLLPTSIEILLHPLAVLPKHHFARTRTHLHVQIPQVHILLVSKLYDLCY